MGRKAPVHVNFPLVGPVEPSAFDLHPDGEVLIELFDVLRHVCSEILSVHFGTYEYCLCSWAPCTSALEHPHRTSTRLQDPHICASMFELSSQGRWRRSPRAHWSSGFSRTLCRSTLSESSARPGRFERQGHHCFSLFPFRPAQRILDFCCRADRSFSRALRSKLPHRTPSMRLRHGDRIDVRIAARTPLHCVRLEDSKWWSRQSTQGSE